MINFIMILYYIISAIIAGFLVWIFLREKEDKETMVLCLFVLVPIILRLLRLK